MTVRYYPGTTDPDLSARANAPTAQAAESMPAVLREQERIAFKDAHRHLELYEVPDAWGRPVFKHSHVEASWFGWIARASHEQASSQAGEYPALVCDYCGALTPDPWHSSGMLHGKMSKHIHSCDACAARGAAQAAPVDAAVQQDAERYRWLRKYAIGAYITAQGKGATAVYLLTKAPALDGIGEETDTAIDAARAAQRDVV